MDSLKDRFLEKILITDTCWLWTATKDKYNYGRICFNKKKIRAHRASWLIFKGDIPESIFVCHKCDTPSCVNPEHLFLGTHKENMRDMVVKKRNKWLKGVSHPSSKLTEEQVRSIKHQLKCCTIKGTILRLSNEFKVSTKLIYNIKKGLRWKHIK